MPVSCHCCATVTLTGFNRPRRDSKEALSILLLELNCSDILSDNKLEHYQFSIFQPAYLWCRFATGHAGHGVITTEVFLCAADVLHPFRKSCK